MLNKIINLINYFRVARYNLYRELKFFYEPPPKKVSEILSPCNTQFSDPSS